MSKNKEKYNKNTKSQCSKQNLNEVWNLEIWEIGICLEFRYYNLEFEEW